MKCDEVPAVIEKVAVSVHCCVSKRLPRVTKNNVDDVMMSVLMMSDVVIKRKGAQLRKRNVN
jgi:hypothetical protein